MKNYSHFLLELSLLLSSCFWRAPIGESKWHGRSRYLDHLQLGDYIDPALIKKFEKKQAIKSITKPLILMKLCIQKFSKVAQPMILPFLLNI